MDRLCSNGDSGRMPPFPAPLEDKRAGGKAWRETRGDQVCAEIPGVVLTLAAFFSYCAGEATCFLWTSSYFAGTREGLSQELIASFGSLIFGGVDAGQVDRGFISNRLG